MINILNFETNYNQNTFDKKNLHIKELNKISNKQPNKMQMNFFNK